jgi:hypothetical protein
MVRRTKFMYPAKIEKLNMQILSMKSYDSLLVSVL